jgi:hypothetical protein
MGGSFRIYAGESICTESDAFADGRKQVLHSVQDDNLKLLVAPLRKYNYRTPTPCRSSNPSSLTTFSSFARVSFFIGTRGSR